MKLGIVVGHTANAGGAVGISLPQEYRYNTAVAQDMARFAADNFGPATGQPMDTRIFLRDGVGVAGAYQNTDQWGADLTAELHYNAAVSSAKGTETLSSGSVNSLKFANLVQAGLCRLLGRAGNSRGVKIRNRQNPDRGWVSLVSGRAPAVITEPAFGSNHSDAALLRGPCRKSLWTGL